MFYDIVIDPIRKHLHVLQRTGNDGYRLFKYEIVLVSKIRYKEPAMRTGKAFAALFNYKLLYDRY